MANTNSNMHKAKSAKNDEFYTMLTDIEKEMKHYRDQFKGKTIYCNCDDARESNFFKYFSLNFEFLGLKKLISTGYKEDGHGVALVYEGDKNGNHKVEDDEIQVTELKGNGDFRSDECIEFLKEADIVVTNPPFSLFREYISQLMEFGKKFCIIGNSNAITYKETFSYIKEGKVWLGNKWVKEFIQPNGETKKFGNICWFTNLETGKVSDAPTIINKYNETEYPKYDNYDAINVDKVNAIPYDYDGVMGVPITIIDKVCSDGFIHFDTPMLENSDSKYRIIDINPHFFSIVAQGLPKPKQLKITGQKDPYARVLIQKVQ